MPTIISRSVTIWLRLIQTLKHEETDEAGGRAVKCYGCHHHLTRGNVRLGAPGGRLAPRGGEAARHRQNNTHTDNTHTLSKAL